jgi:hypothetical protein
MAAAKKTVIASVPLSDSDMPSPVKAQSKM